MGNTFRSIDLTIRKLSWRPSETIYCVKEDVRKGRQPCLDKTYGPRPIAGSREKSPVLKCQALEQTLLTVLTACQSAIPDLLELAHG